MSHALIARQPIVDDRVRVRGYELLYRTQAPNGSGFVDGDSATATVAINTLLDLGLLAVAGEHPIFVNLTRSFFERELYLALPPERVVLEVLEDIEPDPDLFAMLRRARELGYRLALDDYVHSERTSPLVEYADIIKVDALVLDDDELREHARILKRPGLTLLAEKIETRARFEVARDAGYGLFQGWFYARPDLLSRRTLGADRVSLLQVLASIQDPEIDFDEIGGLIACNLALSHKLLRYVNSALFSIPQEIQSIRHACTLLGLERVRTVVMLLLMAEVDDKPRELMHNALSRARMCQLLAPSHGFGSDQKYFTVGLFSLLDAYLDQSLEDLMGEIPLSQEIKQAILEYSGDTGRALESAVACERADWEVLENAPVDPRELQRLYIASLEWTRQVERVLSSADA